jgi:hypothetical protein
MFETLIFLITIKGKNVRNTTKDSSRNDDSS